MGTPFAKIKQISAANLFIKPATEPGNRFNPCHMFAEGEAFTSDSSSDVALFGTPQSTSCTPGQPDGRRSISSAHQMSDGDSEQIFSLMNDAPTPTQVCPQVPFLIDEYLIYLCFYGPAMKRCFLYAGSEAAWVQQAQGERRRHTPSRCNTVAKQIHIPLSCVIWVCVLALERHPGSSGIISFFDGSQWIPGFLGVLGS